LLLPDDISGKNDKKLINEFVLFDDVTRSEGSGRPGRAMPCQNAQETKSSQSRGQKA
jgi:hypothetical protein